MRVKKVAYEYRIRLASWNIGSLTGRLAKLVYAMVRRNVSIVDPKTHHSSFDDD